MTRLALVRHGHTEWNRAGRIQGRSDIPLDTDARAELSGYKSARAMERPLRSGPVPCPVPQKLHILFQVRFLTRPKQSPR